MQYPKDKFITKIKLVLDSMYVLSKSNDFTKATEMISPVWNELSNRNSLYLADIYLLNSILFIFPITTATHIKNFAFCHLERYKNFHSINKVKINFLTNLSLINIKEKDYKTALLYIEDSISMCISEQIFIKLSICYVRKGICLYNLKKDDEQFIEKGLNILKQLEQMELINILNKEVEKYLHR